MDANEREKLITAKNDVSEFLANADLRKFRLSAIDKRIAKYVRSVAKNPDGHNLYEQLAVKSFLKKLDKYGFDLRHYRAFVTLYENLPFPSKKGMTTFELTPVQAFQFANIYGFWVGGKRLCREALLYVPRKFSKTTSTAATAVYDLLFGDADAEIYVGANSKDQARKCFDIIRGCVKKLDPDGTFYQVNRDSISSRREDSTSFAQCLTSTSRTKDGMNASTVIMDEFSQARDAGLLNVLTTSMGVRDNPLTIIITTASDVFDAPFFDMLNGYKRLLLGEYENDHVFAHIFTPDIDDDEGAESTWMKVHPHIGVTVSLDFYREEWLKATRNGAESMLAFRTKLLNVYSDNSKSSWISAEEIKKAMAHISPDSFAGRPDAMVAVDLSERDDFSAVSLGVYSPTSKSFSFHTAYFFPKGALSNHPNESLYRKWHADGHLILLDGDVIDYRKIVEYILNLNQKVRILGIGYDGWKSTEMINMLRAAGAGNVLNAVRQTYGAFTAPVQSFEHGIMTRQIFIDDNPINAYCFGNAILDEDRLENQKPIKRRHSQKIDGVITMLMCLRQFIDYER